MKQAAVASSETPTHRLTLIPAARFMSASDAPRPRTNSTTHEQHDPVEEEEAADDAADVEQVGRALLAAVGRGLGLLGLIDERVAGVDVLGHGLSPVVAIR
jgi:hypothetical protein